MEEREQNICIIGCKRALEKKNKVCLVCFILLLIVFRLAGVEDLVAFPKDPNTSLGWASMFRRGVDSSDPRPQPNLYVCRGVVVRYHGVS